MTMNDTTDPHPASPARPAVAHEMAAIFGAGQRIETRGRAAPPARPTRRRGVRPGMAALLLGALGVAVAGGVMMGRDAVGPMVATAAPPVVAPRSAAAPRATVLPASVAPMAAPPEIVEARPAPAREDAPAVAQLAGPGPRPVAVGRVAATPESAPAPAAAPAVYARAALAPVARTRCFGEEDCLNVRLYDGDGEVARAYRAATQAGVAPRTLREYRSEWLRARDVADRRPREALRIYGMIAADLFDLAGDAAADDRMPPS